MTTEPPAVSDRAKLPRVLGPTEALCVVIGSVIGSGIFIVPARVAHEVPFLGGIALVWVVGGLFSLAGALTLAELAAMLPSAGGPYVYLREAYGRLPAFLFGWTEFLVIRSGSIATLAAAFGLYFGLVIPAPAGVTPLIWQTTAAVIATSFLAGVNVLGTRLGGWVQVVGTALKVGALVTMIVLPFAMGRLDSSLLTPVWPAAINGSVYKGIMAAMISVLWSYDGWVNASALAEDIRDPGRSIPRALILGMCCLIALYLGMTLIYHMVLPLDEIRLGSTDKGSPRGVAADFCGRLLGSQGVLLISLVVMCSVFITLNGNALSGPRAYFAMARDGLFPRGLCRIHPRFQTPANAILAQTAWAVFLMVAGTAMILWEPDMTGAPEWLKRAWQKLHTTPLYDVLYNYVIFGGTIFYGLAITSVFVLRARRPDLDRPYRTWGYPVTPILYGIASLLLLGNMLQENQFESIAGLLIAASGIPAYWFFSRERVSAST